MVLLISLSFARRLSTQRVLRPDLSCIQDYTVPLMKNKHAITSFSRCAIFKDPSGENQSTSGLN